MVLGGRMKPTIIVMSHGLLAQEIVESAKMIVGDVHQLFTVCMLADDGLDGTTKKLHELLKHIHGPILIIADLFGGTPANVATITSVQQDNIRVVTGMNLGMLIEAILSIEEDVNVLAENIVESAKMAIQVVVPSPFDDEDE